MTTRIDARGLSCPEPIMLTRKSLQDAAQGEVVVLVDTMAQVDNCGRAAESLGWKATFEEKDDLFELILRK